MKDRFRFRLWDDELETYFHSNDDGVLQFDIEKVLDGLYVHKGEVLEQCTGLKDKNGKLIYEGDILKDHRQEGGIVKWNNDSAGFAIYEILETGCFVGGLFDWLDKDTNYEVIGNIHENPELLEK